MTLSDVAIRRPVFTTMVVLALMTLGLVGARSLGVDLFPDVGFPVVTVVTFYPGAGPEEVEQLVSKPMEEVTGDLFVAGSNLNQAMHGDRVVARVERVSGGRAEGRIVRVVERGSASVVGRFDEDASGFGFVVPFDRRLIMDVQIPTGHKAFC